MRPRARLPSMLVVALAAHAGVSLWAWRATVRSAIDEAGTHGEVTPEMDIELEAPVPSSGDVVQEGTSASPHTASASAAGAATRSSGLTGATGHGEASIGAPASSGAPEPPSDSGWTFSPTVTGTTRGPDPLAGGALGSAIRGGVGATVAEDTKRREEFARKHVLPIYGERDVELGLAPGGALVSLTRDLVRRCRAPMNGRALLQFDTDGAGLVASVRVLEASSGRAEWNEVASEIAAVARNKPMKVPAGARGVAVTLEVTSALKAFDGATPTSNPLTKAVGVLTDPIDAVANTVEALGGGKNPPQRVVAAHVVNVQAF